MTCDPPANPKEELSPDTIVYRAVLRKSQLNETQNPPKPSPDLFIPKLDKDDDGLSLALASAYTPEEFAATFRKCYGVVRLTVGEIRALDLDVIVDPEDETHILIRGIPYKENEPDTAETIAGDLVGIAFGFERT